MTFVSMLAMSFSLVGCDGFKSTGGSSNSQSVEPIPDNNSGGNNSPNNNAPISPAPTPTPIADTSNPTAPAVSINVPATTSLTSATLTFTSTDVGSGVARYNCSIDSGAFSACSSPLNLNGLSVGQHSLAVYATDVAGNNSVGSVVLWNVIAAAPARCRPVVKQVIPIAAGQRLSCTVGVDQVILNAAGSDYGRVLAKVNLNIVGSGPANAGVHGWTTTTSIGGDFYNQATNFGVGEDICPGEALAKSWLAYSEFSAANKSIVIKAKQYRSNACVDGVVEIGAGSNVELWIEDPRADCVGKDIVAQSYFRKVWNDNGGNTLISLPKTMTTNLTDMVSATLRTTEVANIRVFGYSSISPNKTNNLCGNRFETAVSYLSVNSSYVAFDRQGYATSEGMTHVLLSPQYSIANAPPGTYVLGISAAVDQLFQVTNVSTAGDTNGTDTAVIGVVERAP